MRTLQQAIDKMENKGGAGASLRKHLAAVGIHEWEDITRAALYDFRDHLEESLSPGSAKTLCAYAKSLFHRYEDEIKFPVGWTKILQAKGGRPMKTYLTEYELDQFAAAPVRSDKQALVQNLFLICAYTGLRVSDAMGLTPENIVDGNLHFVARKTKKAGAIPLKAGLDKRIRWIADHPGLTVTVKCYNEAVRSIAKKAGINDEVVVLKAGKEMKGPKWRFLSSHSARVSTASCLNKRGVPIGDICKLLQHSGTAMTERYIVRDRVELSERAMAFFS